MNTPVIAAEQIQREMLSEQQRVLSQAASITAQAESKRDHAKRLLEMGFEGSADALFDQIEAAQKNESLTDQYSFEYPGLKFIPKEVMTEVCKKHGLIIGRVDRYTGEVPEWALRQIEANRRHITYTKRPWLPAQWQFIGMPEPGKRPESILWRHPVTGQTMWSKEFPAPVSVSNLFIAAPRDQMRVLDGERVDENMTIQGIPQDPIVCLSVDGGYIVLAAWGEEGQDPGVFNADNN